MKEFSSQEVFEWFQNQKFQKEQGEQEYTMIYEIDLPKIINKFIEDNLSAKIEQDILWRESIDIYDTADRESYGYAHLVKKLSETFLILKRVTNQSLKSKAPYGK